MKAALIVAAGWMLSSAALEAGERRFDDLVRVISDQLHARPMHIPFFGLVNFATFVAHPAGVKHVDLAFFEKLDLDDHTVHDVAEAIRSTDGRWKPFIRVQSWKHGHDETVLVYMTGDSRDCKLLVVSLEPSEATVVEVNLSPEGLEAFLNSQSGVRVLRPVSKTTGDQSIDGQSSRPEN
jgi:hypothetical protein